MADDDWEEDDLTYCSICLEPYTENGGHVPRMLPCFHTFCQNCISQLIQDISVTCPVCRAKHTRGNDVKKFPQNKYILTHIRRKQKEQKDSSVPKKSRKKCAEHRQGLCFYCKETSCQTEICPECFLNEHRFHEVVNLEEGHQELSKKLLSEIRTLTTDIEHDQQELLKTKDQINKNYVACVTSAQKRRNEFIKIIQESFSKLSQVAFVEMKNTKRSTDVDLAEMEEQLAVLGSVKENMNEYTCEEISDSIETLGVIKAQVESSTEAKIYRCPVFNDSNTNNADIEKLCGFLTQKDLFFEKSSRKAAKTDRRTRPKLKGQTKRNK